MVDDLRCCGTGTCLINAEGTCWCGQQWDGAKMCFPSPGNASRDVPEKSHSTDGDGSQVIDER